MIYSSPEIVIVDFEVEQGFAQSSSAGLKDFEDGGSAWD